MPNFSVREAFELAQQYHRAGYFDEAAIFYGKVVQACPDHVRALHFLGLLRVQLGMHETGQELLQRAIALNPEDAAAYSNLGNSLAAQGRTDEAIAAYDHAILLKPDYTEAHYNRGNALRSQGKLEEALAAFCKAIVLKPEYAEAYYNMGITMMECGKLDQAINAYACAIRYKPDFAEAHNNLGNAEARRGHFESAVAAYRRAIQIRPNYAEAFNNLGTALSKAGQSAEAITAYLNAISLKPQFPEAYHNLGMALAEQRRLEEATQAYRRALELNSNAPQPWNNLGTTLIEQGLFTEGATACNHALALDPDFADAQSNLGVALAGLNRFAEAIAAFRSALQLQPDNATVHFNLGNVFRDQRNLDQAVDEYQRALTLEPMFMEAITNLGNVFRDCGKVNEALAIYRRGLSSNSSVTHLRSNIIYTSLFSPDWNEEQIREEQRLWNTQIAIPSPSTEPAYEANRDPSRRLRVAYVSPDFRGHVVGQNLLPLFRHHDPERFEIFCYSNSKMTDGMTARLRDHTSNWYNIADTGDEDLSSMIRGNNVDILVDLTQHMRGNRLRTFSQRPAPIQVSFAGYPESTGVRAINYRISDKWLEQGAAPNSDGLLVKTADYEHVYLIDSFWCYDPCGIELEANGSSAVNTNWITFGSLNNFCKVNEPLLKLWARVLTAVNNSRLIILAHEGSHRQRTSEFFTQEGVEPERIEFVTQRPRKEYLELYHRLDIVLDTFPYNGHTTSLDALWMGVPVVSLCGERPVSRAGLSQLNNLGLPELVAFTEDQYVEIATKLANDIPRLRELRATLRQRMEKSVLMDGPHFARQIEACYRSMWWQWCESQKA